MLIICNDLSTKNATVLDAINSKNTDAIQAIVSKATDLGFNALELYAGDLENEAEALLFLIDAIQDSNLKLILKVKDDSVYEQILPKVGKDGIIAPQALSVEEASKIFPILRQLGDTWGILFTQTYGNDSVSREVTGLEKLISKAEQEGVMPEKMYMEPIGKPLVDGDHSFLKMKRMLDAFSNSYPAMNFYIDLPLAADGLVDATTLVNVFIGMAYQSGVNAFAFSTEHTAHLEAIKAAEALLDYADGLKQYTK